MGKKYKPFIKILKSIQRCPEPIIKKTLDFNTKFCYFQWNYINHFVNF